jgi:hypothetical protein
MFRSLFRGIWFWEATRVPAPVAWQGQDNFSFGAVGNVVMMLGTADKLASPHLKRTGTHVGNYHPVSHVQKHRDDRSKKWAERDRVPARQVYGT